MTVELLPTRGRVVIAEQVVGLQFLFALSRGDADWDPLWNGVNPPIPGLEVTSLLDVIGYARPTVQGYVVPDPAGSIIADTGVKYAVSTEPTRFIRVRLSVAAGTFPNETVREIGLFARAVLDPDLPSGQTIIPASAVDDVGDLFVLAWFRPQFLSPGTSLARNFIVRL